MDEINVSDQIAQLEGRIESLTESIERCGKISVGAKLAIAAGGVWFVLFLLWILPFNATAFVAAVTAILGGVVLLGSNATTWEQTKAELQAAEAARASLIGRLGLRLVGEEPRTLH
jgi:hypothetical protein